MHWIGQGCSKLDLFLTLNFPNRQLSSSRHAEEYIDEVINYCLQKKKKKIKVTDISDYLGLNRSYLTRLFKQHVGYSLKDYILFLKLDEAKRLLKETSLSRRLLVRLDLMTHFTFQGSFIKKKESLQKNIGI